MNIFGRWRLGTGSEKDKPNELDVDSDGAALVRGAITATISGVAALAQDATVVAANALLTAISGKLPASLGAKTGALSLSVVPCTDTPTQVSGGVVGATAAGVVSATDVSANRRGMDVVNLQAPNYEDQTNAPRAMVAQVPAIVAAYSTPMIGAKFASNSKNLKASAGQVFSASLRNGAGTTMYFCLVNQVTDPTTSQVAVLVIPVAALSTINVGDTVFGKCGFSLSTGVSFAWASAVDTTTPTAPTITTLGTAGNHDTTLFGL